MIYVPHLETDITAACQLSCVACNHFVPLWRSRGSFYAEPGQVAADLGHLSTIMHAERWGALGGEPLLHPKLVELLWIARASRIADRLEVWTNGLLLGVMPAEFWGAFDVLVLSLYPGVSIDLDWIRQRCDVTGVELVVKDEALSPNFRTLLEPAPTEAEATARKFAGCFFRWYCRAANRGYFHTCCVAAHLPELVQGRRPGADGIAIAGLTEKDLAAYLERRDPLKACSICAGRDTAKPIAWRQEREPMRWLRASAGES